MSVEIRVPDFGEVNGMYMPKWLKKCGDLVKKDEVIADMNLESTYLTINSPVSGRLKIVSDHVYVENGQLLARIR